MPEVGEGVIPIRPDLSEFGEGLKRDINGRLRNAQGHFVTEGKKLGEGLSTGFVAGMKQFGGELKKQADDLTAWGKKTYQTGKTITMGFTLPVTAGFVSAFNAASDLGENMSKMEAVFGDASASIEAFARNAAQNVGLSKSAALEATGTFGNLFVQLGLGGDHAAALSQQMVLLAADFASFHNADITEVIQAQSAAFRGEYDSLQRFVPLINATTVEQKALAMTGKTVTSELTAQEKALAVQALMMEGAGDATGDFARTSDSAANQQRILTAEFQNAAAQLGDKLIPIGLKLLGWLSDAVTWFSNLGQPMQGIILATLAFVAALGPLITVIGGVVTAIGAMGTVLAFVAANPIVLILAAVAALVAGVVYAYREFETFRNTVDTVWGAIKTAVKFGVEAVVGFFLTMAEKIVGAAATAFGWVPGIGDKLKDAKRSVDEFRDNVNASLGGIKDKTVNVNLVARQQWADAEVERFARAGDGPGRGGPALSRVQGLINQYPGLYVTSTYRTPSRNRAVGGSPTSYHMDRANPAVDVAGPTSQLDRFVSHVRALGGWRELLWRVPGHWDHAHVAHKGGIVDRSWPSMPGLRSDERPVIAQIGETITPRGHDGGGNTYYFNAPEPTAEALYRMADRAAWIHGVGVG